MYKERQGNVGQMIMGMKTKGVLIFTEQNKARERTAIKYIYTLNLTWKKM